MDELAFLIPIALFISIAVVVILRGPIGKAVADRLAGRPRADDSEIVDLRGDVDEVRRQLAEVQERLDFAERLLARQTDAERMLPPPAR